MSRRIRHLLAAISMSLAFAAVLGVPGVAAESSTGRGYECTGSNGGIIPPGTYRSMRITGVCYMPAGTIVIRGDLRIAAGALLDAVTPGDPSAGNPLLPATLLVKGNVSVGAGAVLLLGCSPNISCQEAITYDHVKGNLTADGALAVVLHSTAIDGDVSLRGGGGGNIGPSCLGSFATNPPTPAPVPPLWAADPSLANGEGPGMPVPVYSDVEDNAIGGDLSITGLHSCWLGTLRNRVGGNATFSHLSMGDPDAQEISQNLVGGNLTCRRNTPAVQFGEGGSPNMVGGRASGECGFGVVLPNPAPGAGGGPSINEPISVRISSLKRYTGTRSQTANVTSITFGTTTSGEQLVGVLNDIVFAGHGLTGIGTVVDPTAQNGGEGVLATIHPDGSSSFTAFDTCTCSFHGDTGTVVIRAYGTTSASGVTRGTFLITGASGGLARLVGYASFTSIGQPAGTLRLVEHLRMV